MKGLLSKWTGWPAPPSSLETFSSQTLFHILLSSYSLPSFPVFQTCPFERTVCMPGDRMPATISFVWHKESLAGGIPAAGIFELSVSFPPCHRG